MALVAHGDALPVRALQRHASALLVVHAPVAVPTTASAGLVLEEVVVGVEGFALASPLHCRALEGGTPHHHRLHYPIWSVNDR